jgi:hypothetical protein
VQKRSVVAGDRELPADHQSLVWGVSGVPGTLHVLAVTGGVTVGPRQGRSVRFGRNRPDVHVCVGENDRGVSRHHGTLTHDDGHWWVSTVGRVPLRLPGARLLFSEDDPYALPTGYTPVFVRGSNGREHLVEVHVQAEADHGPETSHEAMTHPPRVWALSDSERLVLVVLGQRYLLHEAYPNPLSWRQVADYLNDVRPAEAWTAKAVEHIVVRVRNRMSRAGVPGLTRDEASEPIGNTLNHNLIRELMETTSVVPPDLRLIGYDE